MPIFRYENMNLKEYLRKAYDTESRLCDLKAKLEKAKLLEEMAASVRSPSYGVISSKGRSAGFEGKMIEAMDLMAEIERALERYMAIQSECLAMIEVLPQTERDVLFKRYMLGKNWNTISDELKYSKPRLYQIHEKAISHLISIYGNEF